MTSTKPRRSTWVLSGLLVLAVGLAGYWFIRHGWLHVQAALADDQTLYFEEAREKGLQSSRPEDIVRYIEGALNYYPTGTKQTTGSHLDRMVERARRLAVDDMIRHLQSKTGLDLGTDPQSWIERFGENRDQVDATNGSQPLRVETNTTSATTDSRP
ncbi:MAG TPA: hypothetical protein VEC99_05655 [Clostridia bacterium]|nr:hypothetical protein [Clostridia bacterium]